MNKSRGFTIIEMLVTIAMISLLVGLTITVFDKAVILKNEPSDKVYSDLTAIQSAMLRFEIDKNVMPTSFSTAGFVPQYLMVPKIHKIFDNEYGEFGYHIGVASGEVGTNNGVYVCFKAAVEEGGIKVLSNSLDLLEDRIQSEKFFYNTSCPSTASLATFPETGNIYGTFWITRY